MRACRESGLMYCPYSAVMCAGRLKYSSSISYTVRWNAPRSARTAAASARSPVCRMNVPAVSDTGGGSAWPMPHRASQPCWPSSDRGRRIRYQADGFGIPDGSPE